MSSDECDERGCTGLPFVDAAQVKPGVQAENAGEQNKPVERRNGDLAQTEQRLA